MQMPLENEGAEIHFRIAVLWSHLQPWPAPAQTLAHKGRMFGEDL